jgi:hypothetical protein
MRDWKTTISGLAIAVSSFIVLNETMKDQPIEIRIASFILSGGLGFLGIAAKDA